MTITTIDQTSEYYPKGMLDLGDEAPETLWVSGNVEALAGLKHSVTIAGARAATAYGEHTASDLVAGLQRSGVTIVTGGAYGIDAAATRAALALDVPVIVWLGSGVNRLYPSGNETLLRNVEATGAIVSLEAPDTAPTKYRLMQRSKMLGYSTNATVIVEAGFRSGSLMTAYAASEAGNFVGAVPGPITSASSAGTHRLIREGVATLITSAREIEYRLR